MADWARLANYVVARRIDLGFSSREALAALSQLSVRTLADVETGRRDRYQAGTIAALETALRWKPGSVLATIEGGEPSVALAGDPMPTVPSSDYEIHAPQSNGAGDDAIIRIMQSPDLTDEQKARIIRVLIEEQRRFAERRADELMEAFRKER